MWQDGLKINEARLQVKRKFHQEHTWQIGYTCETFQGNFCKAECIFGLNLCLASENTSSNYKSVLFMGSTVKHWNAVMYQMHAGAAKAIHQDISISISSPFRNDLHFSASRSPGLLSLSVFSSTTACFFRLLWVVVWLLLTPYPWPEVQCIRFKACGRCQPPRLGFGES